MKKTARVILGSMFAAGMMLALPAKAVPIPVSAAVGSGLLINFDFSGAVPAPPYSMISYVLSFSGQAAGETIFVDRFTDLDATTLSFTSTLAGPNTTTSTLNTTAAGYLDGLFSATVRIAAGEVELLSATATGTDATGATVTINGSIVPEPATLALLGLGLAGLGFGRRKTA